MPLRSTLLLGIVLLAAGCGSSAHDTASVNGLGRPVGPLKPPSPTALRFSTSSNREFARRDVQKLVRIVVVPRSARRAAEVPKSAPTWFRGELRAHFPASEVAHRVWVLHEPLKQVVRYVATHERPRPRPEVPYRSPRRNLSRIGSRPSLNYVFHPVPGRSWSRWLNVDMLALPDGSTVIVAQAGDSWFRPPPRSAEIPKGVERIDITSRYGHDLPSVRLHVRNAYEVGSIVSWVNGLGVSPSGFFCLGGYVGGSTVRLKFRAADGAVIAHATVYALPGARFSGSCKPLLLTVSGKAHALIGSDLLARLEQHLGVDLVPPKPRDVSACLRQVGWKVQTVRHGSLIGKARHFAPQLTASRSGHRWLITFHATGKVTTSHGGAPAIARCLRRSPAIGYLG